MIFTLNLSVISLFSDLQAEGHGTIPLKYATGQDQKRVRQAKKPFLVWSSVKQLFKNLSSFGQAYIVLNQSYFHIINYSPRIAGRRCSYLSYRINSRLPSICLVLCGIDVTRIACKNFLLLLFLNETHSDF